MHLPVRRLQVFSVWFGRAIKELSKGWGFYFGFCILSELWRCLRSQSKKDREDGSRRPQRQGRKRCEAEFVLELTSHLKGSISKLLRPCGTHWSGFCPVCKRPVEVKPHVPSSAASSASGRFAYVINLWGSSQDYVLGALVLGHSIKRTGTKHSLVCLYADDVPAPYIKILERWWDCRQVRHVQVKAAKQLSTDDKLEKSRFDKVFTKLRALELVEYDKVLVMDIDLLVMSNIDDLFDLSAPAAMKRGMQWGRNRYNHGDKIEGSTFFAGLEPGMQHSWGQGTGINAGVMLWKPDLEELRRMQEELLEPSHPGHVRGNGPEQDYISRFWADKPWRHISVRNNFQVHHMFNALHPHIVTGAERSQVSKDPRKVRVVHFSGESKMKPWSRCLQGSYGWPSRNPQKDEAFMMQVLHDLLPYNLWIK